MIVFLVFVALLTARVFSTSASSFGIKSVRTVQVVGVIISHLFRCNVVASITRAFPKGQWEWHFASMAMW